MKTKIIPHGIPLEYHISCPFCGSSDAVTKYKHSDGRKAAPYYKCFSGNCGRIWDEPSDSTVIDFTEQKAYREPMNTSSAVQMPNEYAPGDNHWGRGLTEETFNAFGVTCSEDGSILFFPHYDYNGNLTGYKQKTQDKKFFWHGDARRSGLFGNKLFKDGTSRRAVTVTEGQEDAMAVYQMFGSKYAAVSIVQGAESAKNLTPEDIKFLSSFEEVVICFDNDEPGRKGAKALAKSFGPDTKVSILNLALKDANEYLKADKTEEFRKAWFNSRTKYRPDGLVGWGETSTFLDDENADPIAHYPFQGMNDAAWGLYEGQVILLTGGSGGGKSTVSKYCMKHLYETTKYKLGCLVYEETLKEVVRTFVAQGLQKNINNPRIYKEVSHKERVDKWKEFLEGDRWVLDNHFGSSSPDVVLEKIRYMAHNESCKFILLDHISIVVSDQESGDERKNLDALMTKLAMMAQELECVILVVSHLKRPDGTPHEEGGKTQLGQLRGTAGLGQLAHATFGFERNTQDDDKFRRNLITVRALKIRKTGETGPCSYLYYDKDRATFVELDYENYEQELEDMKAEALRVKTEGSPSPEDI